MKRDGVSKKENIMKRKKKKTFKLLNKKKVFDRQYREKSNHSKNVAKKLSHSIKAVAAGYSMKSRVLYLHIYNNIYP